MANEGFRPWGLEKGGALLANFIFPKRYVGQIWFAASGGFDYWEGDAYFWELIKGGEQPIKSICFGTGKSYSDAWLSIQGSLQFWLLAEDDISAEEWKAIEREVSEVKPQIGFRPNHP